MSLEISVEANGVKLVERSLMANLFNKLFIVQLGCKEKCSKPCDKCPDFKKIKEFALECEKSCYNSTIWYCNKRFIKKSWNVKEFVNRYSDYCYKVYFCLDADINITYEYFNNDDVKNIAVNDLTSKAVAEEKKHINVRLEQKLVEKVSKNITCWRCKSKEVSWITAQCNAGDEISTILHECKNCHNKW